MIESVVKCGIDTFEVLHDLVLYTFTVFEKEEKRKKERNKKERKKKQRKKKEKERKKREGMNKEINKESKCHKAMVVNSRQISLRV